MSTPSKAYWVKWVDSATHEGHAWRTKKDLDALTPPVCELVGFLYKVTTEYIVFIWLGNKSGRVWRTFNSGSSLSSSFGQESMDYACIFIIVLMLFSSLRFVHPLVFFI